MDSKGSKAPSGDFYRLLCLSVVGPPVRHLKQRLIVLKGGNFNFHAPIGALVILVSLPVRHTYVFCELKIVSLSNSIYILLLYLHISGPSYFSSSFLAKFLPSLKPIPEIL